MSGMFRAPRVFDRRPWVCSRRYYSPHGWRVPLWLWRRMGRTNGRLACFQTSRLHSFRRGES